jgi:hypothetical protein
MNMADKGHSRLGFSGNLNYTRFMTVAIDAVTD